MAVPLMNNDQRNTQFQLEKVQDLLLDILTNYAGGLSEKHAQRIQSCLDKVGWVVGELAALPGNPDGN